MLAVTATSARSRRERTTRRRARRGRARGARRGTRGTAARSRRGRRRGARVKPSGRSADGYPAEPEREHRLVGRRREARDVRSVLEHVVERPEPGGRVVELHVAGERGLAGRDGRRGVDGVSRDAAPRPTDRTERGDSHRRRRGRRRRAQRRAALRAPRSHRSSSRGTWRRPRSRGRRGEQRDAGDGARQRFERQPASERHRREHDGNTTQATTSVTSCLPVVRESGHARRRVCPRRSRPPRWPCAAPVCR